MTEEKEQSSEVKDEDLAQEALDATASAEEETSLADEPEQQGVPVAKHAALRHRAQTAEIAQARLEGELSALKHQQAEQAPAPKSPLDIEVERQAALGILEEDMTISPRIIKANDLYNLQIANQATEANKKHELGVVQLASAKKAKVAHEDWQEVIGAGDALLTPGELLDIAATGVGFGELYYEECQAAITRNVPKTESETQNTAPETKPSKSEAEPKVPTQQEILKGLNVDPATEAAAQL